MPFLTPTQIDLLFWMVESGTSSFVAEGTWHGVTIVKAVGGTGEVRDVEGSDFRELEAQELIRPTTGHGYDLTNLARVFYDELKHPPPERPPVGFRPN
jgi:hypothetical protein